MKLTKAVVDRLQQYIERPNLLPLSFIVNHDGATPEEAKILENCLLKNVGKNGMTWEYVDCKKALKLLKEAEAAAKEAPKPAAKKPAPKAKTKAAPKTAAKKPAPKTEETPKKTE